MSWQRNPSSGTGSREERAAVVWGVGIVTSSLQQRPLQVNTCCSFSTTGGQLLGLDLTLQVGQRVEVTFQ